MKKNCESQQNTTALHCLLECWPQKSPGFLMSLQTRVPNNLEVHTPFRTLRTPIFQHHGTTAGAIGKAGGRLEGFGTNGEMAVTVYSSRLRATVFSPWLVVCKVLSNTCDSSSYSGNTTIPTNRVVADQTVANRIGWQVT